MSWCPPSALSKCGITTAGRPQACSTRSSPGSQCGFEAGLVDLVDRHRVRAQGQRGRAGEDDDAVPGQHVDQRRRHRRAAPLPQRVGRGARPGEDPARRPQRRQRPLPGQPGRRGGAPADHLHRAARRWRRSSRPPGWRCRRRWTGSRTGCRAAPPAASPTRSKMARCGLTIVGAVSPEPMMTSSPGISAPVRGQRRGSIRSAATCVRVLRRAGRGRPPDVLPDHGLGPAPPPPGRPAPRLRGRRRLARGTAGSSSTGTVISARSGHGGSSHMLRTIACARGMDSRRLSVPSARSAGWPGWPRSRSSDQSGWPARMKAAHLGRRGSPSIVGRPQRRLARAPS